LMVEREKVPSTHTHTPTSFLYRLKSFSIRQTIAIFSSFAACSD
jgi:hypothetical protein